MAPSKKKTLKQLAESAASDTLTVHPSGTGAQIPDKFENKSLPESGGAGLPVHASSTGTEIPDSFDGKLGKRAVAPELNGQAIADASAKHGGNAAVQIPEEKKEEKKEDELKEGTPPWLKDKKEGGDEEKEKKDDEGKKEVAEASKKAEDEEKEEIKEHLAALVRGEVLPDSFKEKAATLFEAALASCLARREALAKKKLEEEFAEKNKKEIAVFTEALYDRTDAYLDYITEEWLQDNEVAIESSLKGDIVEGFIGGLKSLFLSHNVIIPENQVNLLEQQIAKVEALEKSLNEEINRGSELKKKLDLAEREAVFQKLTEGLTDVEIAKFKTLSAGVLFESAENFGSKLKVIKEGYLSKKQAAPESAVVSTEDSVILDGGLIAEGNKETAGDVRVQAAADALSRFYSK